MNQWSFELKSRLIHSRFPIGFVNKKYSNGILKIKRLVFGFKNYGSDFR